MESEYNWNIEARRADDDASSYLPAWTADEGGCEGMDVISDENTAAGSDAGGAAISDALEQLTLYEQADRRTPQGMDYEYD